MFRSQVPDLPDLVDLAAPLPDDRSNHVVGDRHLMPGFWVQYLTLSKKWNFHETQHLCSFCSKHTSDLRSRSLLSSLLDRPPPPPVDLRAKSAIASNGELRSVEDDACVYLDYSHVFYDDDALVYHDEAP